MEVNVNPSCDPSCDSDVEEGTSQKRFAFFFLGCLAVVIGISLYNGLMVPSDIPESSDINIPAVSNKILADYKFAIDQAVGTSGASMYEIAYKCDSTLESIVANPGGISRVDEVVWILEGSVGKVSANSTVAINSVVNNSIIAINKLALNSSDSCAINSVVANSRCGLIEIVTNTNGSLEKISSNSGWAISAIADQDEIFSSG